MFTTGFKFYIGISALAAFASAVFLVTNDQVALGSVALLGTFVGAAILAGIALATRDGAVESAQAGSAAAMPAPTSSAWPLVAAVGFVVMVIGLLTEPLVFVLSIVVLLAAFAEWLAQSWSERASADNKFNAKVREHLMGPLELPILVALGLGVIVFSFSRVMLAVSRDGSAVIFIVVAALILLGLSLIALKPKLRTSLVSTVCTFVVLGLVAAGIAAASVGERNELDAASRGGHYLKMECEEERSEHFDKGAEKTVSAKSSVIATVVLEGGKLTAKVQGIEGIADVITVPRSNPSSILFRNKDAKDRRLVAYLGKQTVTTDVVKSVETCTQLVGEGHTQLLTFIIPKPSKTDDPYILSVPGVEGSTIELFVP